jgi:hypothetical protein
MPESEQMWEDDAVTHLYTTWKNEAGVLGPRQEAPNPPEKNLNFVPVPVP